MPDRLEHCGLTNMSISWFEPGKRVTKLKADDPGLFGASWWPYAGYKELQIATYLAIFVSTALRSLRDVKFVDTSCSYSLGTTVPLPQPGSL